MEILKIWENDDYKNVLVKKGDCYYLLQEYNISGTGYNNWIVYEDYNNDKDFLIDENTSEFDLITKRNYRNMYECLQDVLEDNEEYRSDF